MEEGGCLRGRAGNYSWKEGCFGRKEWRKAERKISQGGTDGVKDERKENFTEEGGEEEEKNMKQTKE